MLAPIIQMKVGYSSVLSTRAHGRRGGSASSYPITVRARDHDRLVRRRSVEQPHGYDFRHAAMPSVRPARPRELLAVTDIRIVRGMRDPYLFLTRGVLDPHLTEFLAVANREKSNEEKSQNFLPKLFTIIKIIFF